jgi:hypothetical protein
MEKRVGIVRTIGYGTPISPLRLSSVVQSLANLHMPIFEDTGHYGFTLLAQRRGSRISRVNCLTTTSQKITFARLKLRRLYYDGWWACMLTEPRQQSRQHLPIPVSRQ